MFSNMWMCMCLCMQCSRVYRCHFSVLSSDVWASSLLLWLRAEAPHRGHRFLLRQLCLQAAVQPEVSLQRAHASTQHVRRRHGQEDQGVPLTPPGAGEQLSYLSDTAKDYAHLSTVSFLLPVKMKPTVCKHWFSPTLFPAWLCKSNQYMLNWGKHNEWKSHGCRNETRL